MACTHFVPFPWICTFTVQPVGCYPAESCGSYSQYVLHPCIARRCAGSHAQSNAIRFAWHCIMTQHNVRKPGLLDGLSYITFYQVPGILLKPAGQTHIQSNAVFADINPRERHSKQINCLISKLHHTMKCKIKEDVASLIIHTGLDEHKTQISRVSYQHAVTSHTHVRHDIAATLQFMNC